MLFRLSAASVPRRRGAINANTPWCSHLSSKKILNELVYAITARSSSGSAAGEPKKGTDLHYLNSLHVPVMKEQVLNLWLPKEHTTHATDAGGNDGNGNGANNSRAIRLIDGTVGLGGHTLAAVAAMNNSIHAGNNIRVLGIDRDASVLAKAKKRSQKFLLYSNETTKSEKEDAAPPLDKTCIAFHHGSFSDISSDLLSRYSFPSKVHGILIDCGMNSAQVDNARRGFTFRKHGPLDMRFDTTTTSDEQYHHEQPNKAIKAADIINTWSASAMASIFKKFADEPYADEIAAGIVKWRMSEIHGKRRPVGIQSTLELRYIIEEAIESATNLKENELDEKDPFKKFRAIWQYSKRPPKKKIERLRQRYEERKSRHPNHVMRVFQALRIEVNNELQHIHSVFHFKIASQCLEIGGRLVMIAFHPGEDRLVKEGMDGMVSTGEFKLVTPEVDGLRPTLEEIKINGRSRTARVRAVERIR